MEERGSGGGEVGSAFHLGNLKPLMEEAGRCGQLHGLSTRWVACFQIVVLGK